MRVLHLIALAILLHPAFIQAQTEVFHPSTLDQARERLKDPEALNRAWALKYLLDTDEDLQGDFDPVLDLLDDESRVVLRHPTQAGHETTSPANIASKLMVKHAEEALDQLSALLVTGRTTIRWRVASILGRSGLANAADPLIGAIREDPSKLVRMTASQALVHLGQVSIPKVMDLLLGDDYSAQEQAIWILSEIQDERVIPQLLELAITLNNENAMHAKEALFKLGPKVVEEVIRTLENESLAHQQRLRAMIIAGQLPNARVLSTILYTMLTQTDSQMRQAALLAVSMQRNPLATDALLNLMSDNDAMVAQLAVPTLRQMGLEGATIVQHYVNANPDRAIQEFAISALETMGPLGVPFLLELVKNEDLEHAVRVAAARNLTGNAERMLSYSDRILVMTMLENWDKIDLRGDMLRSYSLKLLQNPEPDIRVGGIILLERLNERSIVPTLIDHLDDPAYNVRQIAEEALQRMGDRALPEMLRRLGRDISPGHQAIGRVLHQLEFDPRTDMERVKYFAARNDWDNLDHIGELAIAWLNEILLDKNPETSVWAAWVLARFAEHYELGQYLIQGTDRSIPQLLNQADPLISREAFRDLLVQGDYAAATRMLVPLLGSNDEAAAVAAEYLGRIGPPIIPLISALSKSKLPHARRRAIQCLQYYGRAGYEPLLQLVNDPDTGHDAYAMLQKMNFKPRNADEQLFLLKAGKEYQQLAQQGDPGARFLVDEALDHDNPFQPEAIRALGKVPRPEIVLALARIYSFKDHINREAAIQALKELGPMAIDVLQRSTRTAHLFYARWSAEALHTLGYQPADQEEAWWLLTLRQEWNELIAATDAAAYLSPFLLSLEGNRRSVATSGLVALRAHSERYLPQPDRVIDEVAIAQLSSEQAEVRAAAADLLGLQPEKAVPHIPKLIEMLNDHEAILNFGRSNLTAVGTLSPGTQAAQALSRIGEPAVDPLIARLKDATYADRDNVFLAISGNPSPRLEPYLIGALDDRRLGVRLRAARSLATLQTQNAIAALVKKALASDLRMDSHIKICIAMAGEGSSQHLIQVMSETQNEAEMHWIIELLGQLGERISEQHLLPLADAESQELKKIIFRSLAQVGGEASIARLILALNEESWTLREVAADALVYMGNPTIGPLLNSWSDEGNATDRYIQKILKQISNRDFGNDKSIWMNWHKAQEALREKRTP